MGATEPRGNEEGEVKVEVRENGREEMEVEDLEMGQVRNIQKESVQTHPPNEFHMSRMQRLSATNPLRLVINNATRVASPSPAQPPPRPSPSPLQEEAPPPTQSRSTPTPQQSVVSLNSRAYTNKISLFVFIVHMVAAVGLVGFLIFKGVQGLIEEGRVQRREKRVLKYFLPQVEAAAFLSIILAFVWQKAVRVWPKFMVHFIIWSSFTLTLATGILLICFQTPATDGIGILFIAFAIGNGLYACWVTQRTGFCSKIFLKALDPVSKFSDLNQPTYWMLGAGFLWMSFWIFAVIGALNFYIPPLIILALVVSLAWTAEVMRNVANLTVCRVVALYYLRGMQSSTQFCFQRALSNNLGSACLGSLFVPSIEALRIVARGLNLIEGEDEFMFSCAHCCLRVMESIFQRGNGWAYVQIAAYGKGFVKASQDTWDLFVKREMTEVVDADITSAICFLTGVCSGSICTIVVSAWTFTVHKGYIGTLAVLAAYIGYLMTRIAMALPQACVSCYYVCYAENPESRAFDRTIPDAVASCLPVCMTAVEIAGTKRFHSHVQIGHKGRRVRKLSSQILKPMESKITIQENADNLYSQSTYDTAMEALSSLISSKRRGDVPELRTKYTKLDRMRMYIKILGLEELIAELKIIHVAGTKGKGSTCSFSEAILRECGFRTGLFTSPHLIDVRERFRLDGLDISEEKFLTYFWDCWHKLKENVNDDLPFPALFQFLTVLAFKIFACEKVDVAIIEVGLGGIRDSTNVIKDPVVCGISPLGMDHMETLGDTLTQIASHKAGIFKPKVPAFTVPQLSEAMDVLQEKAKDLTVFQPLLRSWSPWKLLPPSIVKN